MRLDDDTDAEIDAQMDADPHADPHADAGPLAAILPSAADRQSWRCTDTTVAADTNETVLHYEHQPTGRRLRLDRLCRVYGQDAEGTVRLFGRGGPLALAVALNAVFDGMDELRPSEVVLGEMRQRA